MEFNLKYFSYDRHKNKYSVWMRGVVVVASNDGIVWNYLTTVDAPTLAEANTKSQLSGNTTAITGCVTGQAQHEVRDLYLSLGLVLGCRLPRQTKGF